MNRQTKLRHGPLFAVVAGALWWAGMGQAGAEGHEKQGAESKQEHGAEYKKEHGAAYKQKHDALFKQADTNQDGRLSRDEYEKMTTPKAEEVGENARPEVQDATTLDSFDEKDKDDDGMLTKDELYEKELLTEEEIAGKDMKKKMQETHKEMHKEMQDHESKTH